eukprot:TRINITY_DN858_c0_g1_i1.p1 TRINITY_DN858_c0_g1~~TRINITY_DN858_c0_g1_i1.p1  ORF type:complete len:246 (+),score=42.72 TRINITY_DN858_c0_g1_i1:596-1333(+)
MKVLSLLLLCITLVLCCTNSEIPVKCYNSEDPDFSRYPNAVINISCSPSISGYFSSTPPMGNLPFRSTYTGGINLGFSWGYCSIADDGSEAHCCSSVKTYDSPVKSIFDCDGGSVYCYSTEKDIYLPKIINMQCSSSYGNTTIRIDYPNSDPEVIFIEPRADAQILSDYDEYAFIDGFNVPLASGLCSIKYDYSGAKCCSTLDYGFSGEIVSEDSCGDSAIYCHGNESAKSIVFSGALLFLFFFI